MKTLFLDAPYAGKVELSPETLSYLLKKKYACVGLYASVQFANQLETVHEQLKSAGIVVRTSKADRTNVKGQLLGCDNYHDSLHLEGDIDCFLYIGDGKFHPLALVFAQKECREKKEIICHDPLANRMSILTENDVRTILNQYRASLVKFLAARTVGILHTIKPGQEQFKPSLALETKYPEKEFYHFIDNVISFDQLENFNFIEVWVNTACPRIGFDDQEKFVKGVINLNDALDAVHRV